MITIGRTDTIDLPELNYFRLKAKIDTGAYGCALHCHEVEEIERNGQKFLRFKLLDPSYQNYRATYYQTTKFRVKDVRSSSGQLESRYTIKTEVVIFGKIFPIEFSLTNRTKMKYPVLLGRTFLRNRFIVDVNLKNLSDNAR